MNNLEIFRYITNVNPVSLKYLNSIDIGGDIEIFLEKNGIPESSMNYFTSTLIDGQGIYERDGFPIEVKPFYGTCLETRANNIQELLRKIYEICIKNSLSLSSKSKIIVDLDKIKESGDKESLILGCSPDINIYNSSINKKKSGEELAVRTAGGHVHLSIKEYDWKSLIKKQAFSINGNKINVILPSENGEKIIKNIIKWMDLMAGILSVLLDEKTGRREIYGKAGDIRVKEYGIEYRALSNFWIIHPVYFWIILSSCRLAMYLRDEEIPDNLNFDNIRNIIDTEDKEGALDIFIKNLYMIYDISNKYSLNVYYWKKSYIEYLICFVVAHYVNFNKCREIFSDNIFENWGILDKKKFRNSRFKDWACKHYGDNNYVVISYCLHGLNGHGLNMKIYNSFNDEEKILYNEIVNRAIKAFIEYSGNKLSKDFNIGDNFGFPYDDEVYTK